MYMSQHMPRQTHAIGYAYGKVPSTGLDLHGSHDITAVPGMPR